MEQSSTIPAWKAMGKLWHVFVNIYEEIDRVMMVQWRPFIARFIIANIL